MRRELERYRRRAAATLFALAALAAWLLASSPLTAQTFTPIRVNAGGSAYTDGASNVWSADTGYNTGNAATTGSAIANTTDDTLFQSIRWDVGGAPELEYTFTVPNGWYEVRLLFAESCSCAFSAGARRFDVQLEGAVALSSVDVYAEVGANTALSKSAVTGVADGALNIRFIHGVENPLVAAIEITATTKPTAPTNVIADPFSTTQLNLSWTASIDDVGVTAYEVERCEGASCTDFALIAAPAATSYQDSGLTAATTYRYRLRAVDGVGTHSDYSAIKTAATQGTTPPQPVRINAGGSAYTDSSANVWSADTGYNTGSVATSGSAIAGTTDDTLFQSNRWDGAGGSELEYVVAVPPGQYQVRLLFAETWSGAFSVGARVFQVQLEGVTAFSNLDVFAQAGANTALFKTATTGVADGNLSIRFVHGVENPFVNAVEVLWFAPADGAAPSTPTGLSAVPISGSAIALSWSAASDNVGVTSYAIERCAGAGCSNFTEVVTAPGTARHDTGLLPNTTYRYRLRAVDAAGNRSAYSSIADATTPNASAEYVYDELGRLALVTIASGASIVYSYDESGNVTAIVRAAP